MERHWPPAFRDAGAWPLASLRQSFLDGSLTRLSDPDAILRRQIAEFVTKGDFGLASGITGNGSYERLWFRELVGQDIRLDVSVSVDAASAENTAAQLGQILQDLDLGDHVRVERVKG